MMDDDADLIARMRAQEDQADASLMRLASRIGNYYRYLVLAAVPMDLIPDLVQTYHAELVATSLMPPPRDDD